MIYSCNTVITATGNIYGVNVENLSANIGEKYAVAIRFAVLSHLGEQIKADDHSGSWRPEIVLKGTAN